MIAEKIFEKLEEKASTLTEGDLDEWVIPSLMEYYDNKLSNLAYHTHRGQSGELSELSVKAFKEKAKMELRSAVYTFFFKKEHWKNGRALNPYLRTSLNYLSNRTFWDHNAGQRTTSPVCPACKFNGAKEVVESQSKLLRCHVCTKESDRLLDELKRLEPNSKEFADLQAQQKFFEKFSLHSRKGGQCEDCKRFIPLSIITTSAVCPYPDCWFVGTDSLQEANHPVGVYARQLISLDKSINSNEKNPASLHNFFESHAVTPDARMDMRARIETEYETLVSVIDDQVSLIKRTNSSSTIVQKLTMYEAYRAMLEKYPEEMISYLVHRKQNSEFPIQARIFQEYATLMQDYLPFSIEKNGETFHITDLTDKNLALFLGQSTFEATVDSSNIIPNLTKEEYIGGRMFKNYGRCFIGKIIGITNSEGESLKDKIVEHSFVQIKMAKDVKPGTKVTVKHFRILPHYEMHSLVYLQRIRKQIVDSVYFRLHKKKREIKRKT